VGLMLGEFQEADHKRDHNDPAAEADKASEDAREKTDK
jgi:hypothetical protein